MARAHSRNQAPVWPLKDWNQTVLNLCEMVMCDEVLRNESGQDDIRFEYYMSKTR